MRLLAICILAVLPSAASAADAGLTELSAILTPMRANPEESPESRGATPQFTTIKHRLRDWIETELGALHSPEGAIGIADKLNRKLGEAGLLCIFDAGLADVPECPDLSARGFLKPIVVKTELDLLTVETGVGIQNCGFDESAYAYRWSGGWHRLWQSEQDDYRDGKYLPQTLHDVLISPTGAGRRADPEAHLILTLGTEPWCTSNLHPVYYRLWQTKSGDPSPKPLLDESEAAMLYFLDPIRGSVGTADGLTHPADDVWIEYTVPGVGPSTREEIRHYRLNQGKLERIDPVALGPHDFVDQWIGHRWDSSRGWTDPQVREKLQQWLPKPNQDGWIYPQTTDASRHCEKQSDLWQVKVDFFGGPQDSIPLYFVVSWQPPFHFAMSDFTNRPRPDCTQADFTADHFLTLFR